MNHIPLENLVDIGFTLLVAALCVSTLFSKRSDPDTEHDRRATELEELRLALKDLIGEAGAASRNLDRNLIQRKRELEDLLVKIEANQSGEYSSPLPSLEPSRSSSNGRTSNGTTANLDELADDLPNATWLEPTKVAGQAPPVESQLREAPNGIESLVESSKDTLTLSSQREPKQVEVPQSSLQAKLQNVGSLNEQVEVSTMTEKEAKTYLNTSIMDETTYRIARRLLKSGREIHIVSRKLDLPVSEIRLLDRLMREEVEAELIKAEARAAISEEAAIEVTEEAIDEIRLPKPTSIKSASRKNTSNKKRGFVGSKSKKSFTPADIPTLKAVKPKVADLIQREVALL